MKTDKFENYALKKILFKCECESAAGKMQEVLRGEWLSGLYSLRQVTEVKLVRVRSKFGWVTSEA